MFLRGIVPPPNQCLTYLSVEAVMLSAATTKEEMKDISDRFREMGRATKHGQNEIKLCYVTVRLASFQARNLILTSLVA